MALFGFTILLWPVESGPHDFSTFLKFSHLHCKSVLQISQAWFCLASPFLYDLDHMIFPHFSRFFADFAIFYTKRLKKYFANISSLALFGFIIFIWPESCEFSAFFTYFLGFYWTCKEFQIVPNSAKHNGHMYIGPCQCCHCPPCCSELCTRIELGLFGLDSYSELSPSWASSRTLYGTLGLSSDSELSPSRDNPTIFRAQLRFYSDWARSELGIRVHVLVSRLPFLLLLVISSDSELITRNPRNPRFLGGSVLSAPK